MALSKNAEKLLLTRYCYPGETPKQVYQRVATALSLGDSKFALKLKQAMMNSIFLPNSPCIRNAGTKKALLHACFILPIEDNIESIFDTIKNMATIFHYGGGVGINFSKLRPKDAPLASGGTSSGVLSFMEIFDSVTNCVKQGGFRRGALMGILNFEHAEIVDFIRSKLKDKLTNFNISVLISDKFMEKVINNELIELKNPKNGEIWNKVSAKDLFDLIAFSAWNSGDPGLLFYDRINKDNKYFPKIKIKATNPCVLKGTLVNTPYGYRKVEDLKVGDMISTIYGYEPIKDIEVNENSEIYKVEFIDGGIQYVTAAHKYYGMISPGKWKRRRLLECKPYRLDELREEEYSFVKVEPTTLLNKGTEEDYKKYFDKAIAHCESKIKENINVEEFTTENSVIGFLDGFIHKKGDMLITKRIAGIRIDSIHLSTAQALRKLFLLIGCYPILKNKLNPCVWVRKESLLRFIKVTKLGVVNPEKESKLLSIVRSIISGGTVYRSKITSIKRFGIGTSYDLHCEKSDTWITEGYVQQGCGEVPLPDYGACCLGSLNLAKFVKGDKFNTKEFAKYVEIGTRALLNMNAISWYPLTQITKTMKELNPVGLGVMGFADCLIKLGIYYDSDACLNFIDEISKTYIDITNQIAGDSFYKRIIAPTGSLSILADCSSSIEPIFDTNFERHLTIGVMEENRKLYGSKYVRIAHDITPEWHLKVQAKWQEKVDGACSKTINLPHSASVEDIKRIYLEAWKSGCKGITIFRDGSKTGVLKKIEAPVQRGKCDGDTCHL